MRDNGIKRKKPTWSTRRLFVYLRVRTCSNLSEKLSEPNSFQKVSPHKVIHNGTLPALLQKTGKRRSKTAPS
ncbi:hypothetical protein RB11390 [Rhodopirellula baltica SH 1]|uniref:Uncharacterized protein n=1 Tax=Rhodopirellula baltica (strain DSM 10527 / NCIMB 13988 / SH1) TaxID=243090 RepID=Q7UEE3_RHOBA|nr:hypothetical protein RB11390 [Rhodopirellula baltica SH 1]